MKANKLKERSRNYFNNLAEKHEVIPEPILCYAIVMDYLKKNCTFSSLADISCGTGEMLKRLSDYYGDALKLYGVDLSEKAIARAQRSLKDKADLQVGDVDDLPLDDACADVVLNMHSFHHYPHPVHSLKEIRRILSDRGSLIMVENNYGNLKRIRINLHIARHRHRQGDIKMYSRKQLEALIKEAGFKVFYREEIADHSVLYVCRKG